LSSPQVKHSSELAFWTGRATLQAGNDIAWFLSYMECKVDPDCPSEDLMVATSSINLNHGPPSSKVGEADQIDLVGTTGKKSCKRLSISAGRREITADETAYNAKLKMTPFNSRECITFLIEC
jgi:hypothetical protein